MAFSAGATSINIKGLTAGWRTLGIKPGDCVMVHSSMRTLGKIVELNGAVVEKPRAAAIVNQSLLECVGERGTIVQPGLSGTGHWLTADNPVWTRTKEIARFTIPEVFRQMEGTIRSLHPTHSVCANGYLAEALTAGHENAPTPCGIDSPYAKLIQFNAKILLIGVDLNSCTLVHHLEEKYNAPGHMQAGKTVSIIIEDLGIREFRYHLIPDMEGFRERNFNLLAPFLKTAKALVEGQVGEAPCLLVTDLNKMDKIAAEQFEKNPSFLIV